MRSVFASLRMRLLVLVLIALLPPFVLLGLSAMWQHRLIRSLAEDDAFRLARAITNRHSILIDEARQLLTLASRVPEARSTTRAECGTIFEDLLRKSPSYGNFGLISRDGQLICSAAPPPDDLSLGDRSYFQRALRTRDFAMGEFQLGRVTGRANLPFGVPVIDELGDVWGVVFAALDLTWLADLAADAGIPPDADVTIFDQSGTILGRYPDPEQWIGRSAEGSPLVRAATGRHAGGTEIATGVDGVERLYAFAPLVDVPGGGTAYAAVGVPMTTVLAEANAAVARELALLVAAACLAAAAAWWGSDLLILRQVRALARVTERLAAGELEARVGAGSHGGELGQLGRSFDQMAEAVQQDVLRREREQAEREELLASERQARSDLQRAQSQLVQQERLRALGEMASGVAHDFNNALSPIVGYTELLLIRPELWEDRAAVLEYLRRVSTAAQDAASVVNRLREFYRSREFDDETSPVDLGALALQVAELTRPRWQEQARAENRQIVLETDVQRTPPVLGNASELRECLTNLIFNAVDALPTGGRIVVGVHAEGGMAQLTVTDTGVGMTEETRRRCLEPFFTTKGAHGTGLGLAMVYGIVQRHGGQLHIDSAPGQGTSIRIQLPVTAESRPSQAETGELVPGRSLHILVVDDQVSVAQLTATYLSAGGHTSEIVTEPSVALERFQRTHFDLVVTDQAMAGMSGEQLARAIKELSPDTPVILLTGFGGLMQAAGEPPAGVDRVVGKPTSLNELLRAVADVSSPTVGTE